MKFKDIQRTKNITLFDSSKVVSFKEEMKWLIENCFLDFSVNAKLFCRLFHLEQEENKKIFSEISMVPWEQERFENFKQNVIKILKN